MFNQWRTLRDDQLLAQANQVGFTALVTTDKKLGAQQRHPPGEHRLVTIHR